MSEIRFQRTPNRAHVAWSDALWLESGVSAALFEGEAAEVIRQLLEACATPRTIAELEGAFPHLDEEDVEAIISLLEEHGQLERRDRDAATQPRPVVVGSSSAARSVAKALDASPPQALAALDPASLAGEGSTLVLVASSILDPTLTSTLSQLPEELSLVPCVISPRASLIGPAWRRGHAVACPRCLALRWLARASPDAHAAWRGAEASGAVSDAGVDDEWAAAIGRALRRQLAGEGSELLVVEETQTTTHPLRPHPGCRNCAPAPLTKVHATLDEQRARVESAFAERLQGDEDLLPPSAAELLSLADPRTGLVFLAEDAVRRRGYFRELPFVYGGFALAREDAVVSSGFAGAAGVGTTLEHKRAVCLSEALERYAQHLTRPDIVEVSARALGDRVLPDVAELAYEEERYAEEAFPYRPFTPDTPLWWRWGVSLLDGRARLLPEETIALRLDEGAYPTRLFDRGVSTGGAAHVSYHRALCSALREVAERDQAMLAWYKRVPLPRVRVPERTGDEVTDELQAYLRGRGVRVDVFDLRLDLRGATVLLVSATRSTTEGNWPAGGRVTIASCRPTPLEALQHGLLEICVSYETQCLSPDEHKDYRSSSYDPHDPRQGWSSWWPLWLYYLDPAHADAFAFLDGELPPVALFDLPTIPSEPRQQLSTLVTLFESAGLEPYAFDLTTPDLEGSGRRAVKVVVPGTLDASVGRQSVRLRTPRLEEVPRRLGRPHLPTGEHNPDPHPAI